MTLRGHVQDPRRISPGVGETLAGPGIARAASSSYRTNVGWSGQCELQLRVDSLNDPLVLRFYLRDPTACQREVDIYRLIAGTVQSRSTYAQPNGVAGLAPFVLLRYVEGIPFRELRRTQDAEAIAKLRTT